MKLWLLRPVQESIAALESLERENAGLGNRRSG